VLTGILAGLTAQFGVEDWARVLSFGVYLHGLAGDIAASRVGEAPLIATDLIEAIPDAYGRVLAEWGSAPVWQDFSLRTSWGEERAKHDGEKR
jgi:hypothetical protein